MTKKDCIYDGTKAIDLRKLATEASEKDKKSREKYEKKTAENIQKISEYQEKLYADGREGIIFVLQARDAAGKDSTIKNLMTGINPQGVEVHSFKAPSKEELAHDFLWRFNKCIPARGMISIFNRSYYEDVLVVKIKNMQNGYKVPGRILDKDYFNRRYAHINNYENELYYNGYQIIKVFLNVSKEEQKKRFLERIDKPEKNWKFSADDLTERALWDEYTDAFQCMIEKTSTKESPWYVIPADSKWFARYLISELFLDRLKKVDPRFPELSEEEKAGLQTEKETLLAEK